MILSDFLILFSLILVISGFSLYLYFSLFSKLFFQKKQKTTPERASTFGEFINGLTGPIFALAGFLIIYATIIDQNSINNIQQFESNFFKLLDYHRVNNMEISIKSPRSCNQIMGNTVWLSFYTQIKKAYNTIQNDNILNKKDTKAKIDIAFSTFYYGVSKTDTTRIYNHLKLKHNLSANQICFYFSELGKIERCTDFSKYHVGYTNKCGTFLLQYFSFINYIDKQKTLSSEQKEEYMKMLNLQNDNFCQLVIYYYLKSTLCKAEELKMNSKYNLLPRIDKSLLFHLNPNEDD
jgi:hypothetical protein